jgi:hypothetical protein
VTLEFGFGYCDFDSLYLFNFKCPFPLSVETFKNQRRQARMRIARYGLRRAKRADRQVPGKSRGFGQSPALAGRMKIHRIQNFLNRYRASCYELAGYLHFPRKSAANVSFSLVR